jgi:hypothetical protein
MSKEIAVPVTLIITYCIPISKTHTNRHWWLTPVILAVQEAEIRRLKASLGQIVCKTLSRKNPSQKRAGGVAQGVGPEFKSQYQKKKKTLTFYPINMYNHYVSAKKKNTFFKKWR